MSSVNSNDLGEDLVRRISSQYSVPFTTQSLTEKMTAYSFDPSSSEAARVSLIISPFDVTIVFGLHLDRIELSSLPGSEERLMEIVGAIASGGLVSTNRKLLARYRLALSDGKVISGGSIRGVPFGPRVRKYVPW